ncbi:hypothetical protein [Azospirillum rugosum]|uniref:DUF2336 domain-containing protein n=1 Tax=Azospirillum rugosum TaxID=416170 RepID=A0ABS4SNK9_9PROT|nr:hypothetical protein [Azospirillum rugosum]MBP2294151.1 hypothetical protein [Azospirillum rugosum]MDQ0527460.1 hypothetical protein [Azospirillum rugosum]
MKRQDKEARNRAAAPALALPPAATQERSVHRPGAPRSAPPPAPTPLRGAREARDAVTLARLLRGTITPMRADEVLALLEPHRPRLVPKPLNPLATMIGQPQGRLLEALLRPTAPIVLDVLLPRLRDHLIDRLVDGKNSDTDELPSALDVAAAMKSLVTLLRGAGRGAMVAVVAALEADARADADRLVRAAPDAEPGAPGSGPSNTIDALAQALLRFETRRLVLETLGSTTALKDIVYQSRRLTRFALRRATDGVEGFVADRGIKALHASLATLASVDGLVVVVLRNLDDQEESREEASPFVEPADRKALNDYLSAAWRLSDTLFDLVGKAANGGELGDLLFEALLRQLGALHQFCTRIDHAGRPATLDTLEQRLVDRTNALARLAGERLIETILARPCDVAKARRLLARSQSLAQLLYDMGHEEELEELALRLVVAREALEHGTA